MSKSEAGRRGGEATKKKYGKEHYKNILEKGRQRQIELIEAGKAALAQKEEEK